MAGDPLLIVAQLAAQGLKHLYIDGGQTIQAFLAAGLINEITITRIPVLLGKGIPLFSQLGGELNLSLIDSSASDNGFVQSRYQVLAQACSVDKTGSDCGASRDLMTARTSFGA